MTTYQTSETSLASGAPVELYRFALDRTGGGGTGTGGGGRVADRTLEAWAYSDADINDLLAQWPYDAVAAGGGSSFGSDGTFSVTTFYSGGLGGGQGHVYHYRTFGASDGLVAGETGRLSVPLTLSRNPSPFACGVAVDQGDGRGAVPIDLAPDTPLSLTLTQDVTVPASGQITVRLGHFDLEFGEPTITLTWGPLQWTRLAAAPDAPDAGGDAVVTVHYTSADVPIVFGGDTYLPAILERDGWTSGGSEDTGDSVTLTLPANHAVARYFSGGRSYLPLVCTRYRLHRANLTANADGSYTVTDEAQVRTPALRFQVVGQPVFAANRCTLTLAPPLALLKGQVPRFRAGPRCPFMLFDAHTCQASKTATAHLAANGAQVTAVDGDTVTIAGLADRAAAIVADAATRGVTIEADEVYTNGVLIGPSGPQRTITAVSGDQVTLLHPIPDLAVGDAVDVLAGCEQTPRICHGVHDNLIHFGGHPGIPRPNPATTGLTGA